MKSANWKSTKNVCPPKNSLVLAWDSDNNCLMLGYVDYSDGYPEIYSSGQWRGFEYWMHAPLNPFGERSEL